MNTTFFFVAKLLFQVLTFFLCYNVIEMSLINDNVWNFIVSNGPSILQNEENKTVFNLVIRRFVLKGRIKDITLRFITKIT